MASFTPSKKTAQDFNDGVEYIDGYDDKTGDVVRAESINNVIESQLWTQEQAENAVNNASGAVATANNALVIANSLDGQIKTANATANMANQTSQEAKSIAEDAQKGVGTKVTVENNVVPIFDADTKVNKAGDMMTGELSFNISGSTTTPTTLISNTAGWQLPIIRFKADNADGAYVCLGSKGCTVVSSGESYQIFETNGSIGSEDVCLISDYNVKIFTNLQNGWDNRHESRFLTGGGLVLNVTNGSYNEGVRVNASADAYAGIYLGNDLNTYSGRDTTKGWMIARPSQEDGDGFPLLIAAQGNQSVDSKRVRITRDGDIYSRGSILYSANHMPPTPNIDTGTILYNTTSVSTGAKTLSESMGSFDLLVIVANWNGNQTCYTVPYYDFYDTSATSWLTVSTDSKYLNIYYRSSTSVYIIGFTSGISSVKIVGHRIVY